MEEFKTWQSYSFFAHKTIRECRYIHDNEILEFLSTLWETSSSRVDDIKNGSLLWRAQLGCDYRPHYDNKVHVFDEETPYSEKRMKPLADRATEGRANPKGIPHLYLATEKDTAMAEVRPWVGSKVTLAIFKIVRDLKIVNFTNDSKFKSVVHLTEPTPEAREETVWAQIDNAFSRPVLPTDHAADYIPTQIITELFKVKGIDGLAYKSNLGKGLNIVLFNLDDAKFEKSSVYNADDVKFIFSQASPTIVVKKPIKYGANKKIKRPEITSD